VNRAQVEQLGRDGRAAVSHPLGMACRVLNRVWLVTDPEDIGFTPHAEQDGFWESWVTAWFLRQLAPGVRVLDVGANQGYYGLLAASYGCETLAIEPQPRLYARLLASQAYNEFADDLYYPVQAAVGAKHEAATFYVPPKHGMNAGFVPGFSPEGTYDTYQVEVEPLDQIVADFIGFDTVEPLLIKVDVEGAEPLMWEGMSQTWAEYAGPVTLLMEFRWDRYQDPLAFSRQLLTSAQVTYVDYDGTEQPVRDAAMLGTRPHEDWMLVLRRPTPPTP
jgi:FkbM family methyltransferase